MMLDKDTESRRLHRMATSLWVILVTIAIAFLIDNHTLTFIVLAFHAYVFLIMMVEVRRDIDALGIKPPEAKRSPKKRSTA